MKVTLVYPCVSGSHFYSLDRLLPLAGVKAIIPPLGLLTLAALLPPDWDVRLADLRVRAMSEPDWEADVVMVSAIVLQKSGLRAIITEARRRRTPVVVGGWLATLMPEPLLEWGADIVVKGEAETTVPVLLEHLRSGRSGIVVSADGLADLTRSPAPPYAMVNLRNYLAPGIQFSRGCPFQCEFCNLAVMLGRQVRTKTPGQIVEELDALYRSGVRGNVLFVDDNLIGDRARAKAMLRELVNWMEQRQWPFWFETQVSINLAADDELLDLMVRAGFIRVLVGVESTDATSLRGARKYQNVGVDAEAACRKINEAGMQVVTSFIVGLDNERPRADRRIIAFAERAQIAEVLVTPLQAAPGTPLWRRLEAEGRLVGFVLDGGPGTQTALPNFVTGRPVRQIVEEIIAVFDRLYDERAFLERAFAHFRAMKRLPPPRRFTVPTLAELRTVAVIFFRRGVLYRSRFRFWLHLVQACIHFPRELSHYLALIIAGEHYQEFKDVVRRELHEQLSALESGRGTGDVFRV